MSCSFASHRAIFFRYHFPTKKGGRQTDLRDRGELMIVVLENTFQYQTVPCFPYLDFCLGENPFFSPPPFTTIAAFIKINWLIEWLICTFVKPRIHWCIRICLFPVQMPSLFYIIFAKKAENKVFWPTGWVGFSREKNFLIVSNSSRPEREPVFAVLAFLMSSVFSPTNKTYLFYCKDFIKWRVQFLIYCAIYFLYKRRKPVWHLYLYLNNFPKI